MSYPEKITDLTSSELVSDPVVYIDYDLLGEINAWAIRENKTPVASAGSGF